MNRSRFQIMPHHYFLILLVLSLEFYFLLPIKNIVYAPYTYLGIALFAIGMVLGIWADSLFKRSKTPVKLSEKPRKLVTSGPFYISRNPMYLGMLLMLFGLAIFLGSVATFVFPMIFLISMETLVIPYEERGLERTFKKRYSDYRKRVRRWV